LNLKNNINNRISLIQALKGTLPSQLNLYCLDQPTTTAVKPLITSTRKKSSAFQCQAKQ